MAEGLAMILIGLLLAALWGLATSGRGGLRHNPPASGPPPGPVSGVWPSAERAGRPYPGGQERG